MRTIGLLLSCLCCMMNIHAQDFSPTRDVEEMGSIRQRVFSFQNPSADKRYYLILTTPQFSSSVERFARWKSLMGYNVFVLGDHGGSTYSNTYVWNDERILSAIDDAMDLVGDTLRYVLFVGDEQNFPGHQCHYVIPTQNPSSPEIYDVLSDYYYECLGDTSNNGPVLRVGRIPVSSNAEAEHVFDKIISYESAPSVSESFYRTVVSSAVFDGGAAYNRMERGMAVYASEQISSYLEDSVGSPLNTKRIYLNTFNYYQPSEWQWNNLYTSGGAIPAYLHDPNLWTGNSQNVTDSINAGTLIYSYMGGGSETGWVNVEQGGLAVTLFSEGNMDSLANTGLYPVVFSMSNHTGEYQHSTNCPAEFFLKKEDAGAVAVIAPSGKAFIGYTEYLNEGLFNSVWPSPGINQLYPLSCASYELGDILAVSKEWMGYMQVYDDSLHTSTSQLSDDAASYHLTMDAFHLFGDPSMQIYTEKPSRFTDAYLELSGSTIVVHTGEPDTKVTFFNPTLYDETQNTASYIGSDVTYIFDADNTDTLYICIRKHNFVPAILKYVYDPTIQNETLTSRQVYIGHTIDMGHHVTSTKPQGNAVVASGGDVTLKGGTVRLQPGTVIELGAKLSVNPQRVRFVK